MLNHHPFDNGIYMEFEKEYRRVDRIGAREIA